MSEESLQIKMDESSSHEASARLGPLPRIIEKQGQGEPASISNTCGMSTDDDDDGDNDSLASPLNTEGSNSVRQVEDQALMSDNSVTDVLHLHTDNVEQSTDNVLLGETLALGVQEGAAISSTNSDDTISTRTALEVECLEGIKCREVTASEEYESSATFYKSPLSSDSEGPRRSTKETSASLPIPASISYDTSEEMRIAQTLQANGGTAENMYSTTEENKADSGEAAAVDKDNERIAKLCKAHLDQAQSASQAVSCGNGKHRDHLTPTTSTGRSWCQGFYTGPPRTNLGWSVSVDGAIPLPPASLEAGRNFSAPGAFRMYQTGVSMDEPEGSESFSAPHGAQSIVTALFMPAVEDDISPPALQSATTEGSYVVEAQLVHEQSQSSAPLRHNSLEIEMVMVEAKPLNEAGFFRIRRRVLCLAMTAIVAIALCIGVRLGQRERTTDNVVTRVAPFATFSPSASPVALPPLRDQFDASLPSYTIKALKNKNSTQSRAYAWAVSRNGMANVASVERLLTRFALAVFYFATGGAISWKDDAGWLTAAHECDWFVHEFYTMCPDDGETASYIALQDNDLKGTLPAELGLLRHLHALDVSSNHLTGTVPIQLADASFLEILILFDNQLENLSAALSVGRKLKYLHVLDLEYNFFTGQLPTADELDDMPALHSFYIGGNEIRGALPSDYSRLPSLTSLLLGELHLTGSLPSSFAMLSGMELLYLYNNSLTGTVPEAPLEAWQHSIWQFDIAQNNFTGTLSTKFGLLTSLSTLSVFNNQFTGRLPTELGMLTQLTSFWCYANEFTGKVPTELGLLTNVQTLYLSDNALTGTIPMELALLTDLTSLDLSGNQLSGSVPEGLCQLKKEQRYSGFSLNVDCDRVACDCDCTCAGGTESNERR